MKDKDKEQFLEDLYRKYRTPDLNNDPAKPDSWLGTQIYHIKNFTKKSRQMLICMELKTGDYNFFRIKIPEGKLSFDWHGNTYIIDESLKYYIISAQVWCLDYHEDFSMPVKRRIPVKELRKAVSAPGVTDVDMAINPSTLKYFIESEVIQKVMKGAELEKVFDFMKKMLILIAIVTIAALFILIKGSGMLDNIKIPGFGG